MDNSRRKAAMINQIARMERKFVKVCNQINILEKRLDECSQRRDAGRLNNQQHFVYSLTLRMGVLEGVINVLYEYVRHLARDVQELRWLMYRETLIIMHNDDDDDDDDFTSGDEKDAEEMEHVYLEIPL